MTLRATGVMLAVALLLPAPARAEDADKQRLSFIIQPSTAILAAAHRYGRTERQRADAALRPLELRVAVNGATTLISLQSVAVCDSVNGCPLLVFHNITEPPLLHTKAFENVLIQVTAKGTILTLSNNAGPDRECLVSVSSHASCHPVRAGN